MRRRVGRRDDEIDRELRFHIEMRARELEGAGLSPDKARREAERMFGRQSRVAAVCARAWRHPKGTFMRSLFHDLRDAGRGFVRQPAITTLMCVTLALGIGATTAIYTLVDAVVLRPLPYEASDRLVWLQSRIKGFEARPWGASAAGYFHFRERNETLAGMGAFFVREVNLVDAAGPERVTAASATASLREVLGAALALGRWISPEEDVPNGPAVAVFSHEAWQRRYGGDPDVIGRMVSLDGVSTEVIGVLAEGFDLPLDSADVYRPVRLNPATRAVNAHYLSVIARMKPGVEIEQVQGDLRRLDGQLTERFPNAYPSSFVAGFATQALTLRNRVIGSASRTLWLLLGAMAIVLLTAFINVANLYLVRSEARRRELSIRAALGASRGRIARQSITEGVLLTSVAAAVGLALASAGVKLLVAAEAADIPRLAEVTIRWSSVAFAALLAAVSGIALGLFPLRHARADASALREEGRSTTASRGQQAVRRLLVGGEVALALVLLASALLLVQSFARLRGVAPGFDASGVLTFDLSLSPDRYASHEDVARFYRDLTTRVEALPGVDRAAVSTEVPLVSWRGCSATYVERPAEGQQGRCVGVVNATPGFAEALGLRVAGTLPDWTSHDARRGTVLITRPLAERYWPGENPIGRRVTSYADGPAFYAISGVVEGLRAEGLDGPEVESLIYPVLPMETRNAWPQPRQTSVLVRSTVDPESLIRAIRRELASLDPEVPIGNVMTMEQAVARSMAHVTFAMALIGIVAMLALTLSLIGVYGVVSYLADRRRSEIAIRMALGASPHSVRQLIVGQSVTVIAAGIAIGGALSLATTKALASMLFGVEPRDLPTLGLAMILVSATALVAAWLPATRAARISPIEALRG